MKASLKSKFIIIFIIIICCIGITTIIMGNMLINKGIINQVQDRVRNDLNSADEIYNHRISTIKNIIHVSTFRDSIINALLSNNKFLLDKYLNETKKIGNFEILSITNNKANVIHRSSNYNVFGDSLFHDSLIQYVLKNQEPVASTELVSPQDLEKESKKFKQRAHIKFKPTPKAKTINKDEENQGMMLKVACPVFDKQKKFIGILYGGELLNRNYSLVDKIKNTIYQGEKYKGKNPGTATIFQNDVRISTNVMTREGARAIGTRVSEEVSREVLEKGKFWIKRAFVVNDWYITAYKPIKNIAGEIVGILYVGMMENKFTDMKREAQLTLFMTTLFFMIFGLFISNIFTKKIISPINYLVQVSKKI